MSFYKDALVPPWIFLLLHCVFFRDGARSVGVPAFMVGVLGLFSKVMSFFSRACPCRMKTLKEDAFLQEVLGNGETWER